MMNKEFFKKGVRMPKNKIINLDNYENLFIRIHQDEKKVLKEIALKKGVSLSVLMRQAVKDIIEKDNMKQ